MFKNAYETTACSVYKVDAIKEGIEKDSYSDNTVRAEALGINPNLTNNLQLIASQSSETPAFAHPFYTPSSSVSIDVRGFVKNASKDEYKVTSKNDLEFYSLYGALANMWRHDRQDDLLPIINFPLKIYIRWVGNNLSRRLSLSPDVQMTVSVIAGFFFLSQFKEEPDLSEKDKQKMAASIARNTQIPIDECMRISDLLNPMETIHDLAAEIKRVTESIRLKDVNAGLLTVVLISGWLGANSKEVSAVAIEYPPAFIAMVAAAIGSKFHQKSMFGRMVKENDRRKEGAEFVTALSKTIAAG